MTIEGMNVSRETQEKLALYVDLLTKWTARINLISKSTIPDIWERHIKDSLQLARFLTPEQRVWADIGSGGGLPGLVLAIAALELAPDLSFDLVEVDQRKATFLREVARQVGLPVRVHASKIEQLAPLQADVLSARALAPLAELCVHAARHLAPHGMAIFPKGGNYLSEIEQARQNWDFHIQQQPSTTLSEARILVLSNIHHV